MLRYAKPLIKHYDKVQWTPAIPKKIKSILHDVSESPLKQAETTFLLSYYMRKQRDPPTFTERNYVIRYLYERQAFTNVVTIGKKLLFVDGGNSDLRDDVSFNELKRYFRSLVRTKSTYLIDITMTKVIAQFSISRRPAVIDLINSIFVDLHEVAKSTGDINEKVPILKWTRWVKLLMGHCNFTNYIQYKYILKTMLFYLREKRINDKVFFNNCLTTIHTAQGSSAASQFASTLLYLFAYTRNFEMVGVIWSFKIKRELPVDPSDLTCILKKFCHFKEFSLVKPTYEMYPQAHNEDTQFDYLLVAHANSKDWQGLQQQFNTLFGIGELPNILHYGIVMHSMARIGELESVDKLYTQLLRRKMIPTYPILHSLLLAHYKTGDLNGCFTQFELFEKYSIAPSASAYTIMFKVYRGLGDIDGGLRLLKKMTENDKATITETHFAILIHMCSRFTNIPIAQELFNVMINDYDILPTGAGVASLMDVYIESGMPQEALKLFKQFAKVDPVRERLISIYSKAIKACIFLKDQAKCESIMSEVIVQKITTDAEFYKVTIQYLVDMKKDFETAEHTLEQLIKHPKFEVDASHYETIMQAYDKISYHQGVFDLYKKMNEQKVPVNSKILYLMIKATFKFQMQTKGDLDRSIELLDKIMKNAANHTLDITFSRLHPSVIAWPMRVVAKFYNPMKALDLLNRYRSLFYGNEDSMLDNKFIIMRSLMVLYAEIEQWEDFDIIFQKYILRIEQCQKIGSTTVKNKKLSTLFVGLLSYKVQHLLVTQNIKSLPELLEKMQRDGFVIDNNSWNVAIRAMFEDSRTIEFGLKIVNDNFIHGFNLIHKHRLLKRFAQESTAIERQAWLLEQKKEHPESFTPSLYLKSEVYARIMASADQYLNKSADLQKEVRRLIEKYPHFMKNYLMKPREQVQGWSQLEEDRSLYMEKVRSKKRVIPVSEF